VHHFRKFLLFFPAILSDFDSEFALPLRQNAGKQKVPASSIVSRISSQFSLNIFSDNYASFPDSVGFNNETLF
jgi:hypothetical protein